MRLFVIVLLMCCTAAVAGESALQDTRLDPGTAELLAEKTPQRLMVRFADPAFKRDSQADGYRLVADDLLKRVADHPVEVVHRYRHVPAMVVMADAAAVKALLADVRVQRIGEDAGGGGGLASAGDLVGADALRAAGFTGAGRSVAVLDSGHDENHPDLAGRTVAEYCFCGENGGCCPDGSANQQGMGAAADDHGHGTHVSSIVLGAGNVAASGIAPQAELVSIKVLDKDNRFCCSGDIVAGLDRVLEKHPEVDVVNLSLGTDATFDHHCDQAAAWTQSLADAVDALHARGTLVTVSSMNQGNRDQLPAPACLSNAVAVGAVWARDVGRRSFSDGSFNCSEATEADKLACFSNTSDMLDVLAPGAPIMAARLGGGTQSMSGTSMAAPMVAGCIAVLRERVPAASSEQILESIQATPTWIEESVTRRIFPRLDCQVSLEHLVELVGDEPALGAGFSGAWYSPQRDGEGWVLEMLADGTAAMYWFTYDLDGQPLWLLGTGGEISGNQLHFDALIRAAGPRFGAGFDPGDFQAEVFGELKFEFDGCDSGQVSWQADDEHYGSGNADITRLTYLDGVSC